MLHLIILRKSFGLILVDTVVIAAYYWRFCEWSFFTKHTSWRNSVTVMRSSKIPVPHLLDFGVISITGPLHSRKLKLLQVFKDEKFRLLFQISGLPCHHIEAQSSCHRLCGTCLKPDHKQTENPWVVVGNQGCKATWRIIPFSKCLINGW